MSLYLPPHSITKIATTVGGLRRALEDHPDELPIMGDYGNIVSVALWHDDNRGPICMIDTDPDPASHNSRYPSKTMEAYHV